MKSLREIERYAEKNCGNENLRLSVLFFIIVMDSGSLKIFTGDLLRN
jgi:hypothetical protein